MIKVRAATLHDIPHCYRMLVNFSKHSWISEHRESYNRTHVYQLLTAIISGMGYCWVTYDSVDSNNNDGPLTGLLLAIRNPNIWDPHIFTVDELAWWVEPPHRHTRSALLLFREYRNTCSELLANKQISGYTISKISSGADIDYSRYGATKQQETWTWSAQ